MTVVLVTVAVVTVGWLFWIVTKPEAFAEGTFTESIVAWVGRLAHHPRHRCAAAGWMGLLLGLWFLVIAPSSGAVDGMEIANLHRMTLGETFTIAGAIFLAAAWSPRG